NDKESVEVANAAERSQGKLNVRTMPSGSWASSKVFEKTESVFEISECTEGKKVKFTTATLEGPTVLLVKTNVQLRHLLETVGTKNLD
ncbi:hypothetical protein Tco_0960547, partial [Tanacetum coccineum]